MSEIPLDTGFTGLAADDLRCHETPLMQLRIRLCEIEMNSWGCDRLPKKNLRDCRAEVLFPTSAPKAASMRVAACLKAYYQSTVGSALDVIEMGWDEAEIQARYYSPEVFQSCTRHEASGDMQVARKCKELILQDFPDLKAKYDNRLDRTKYADILDAVQVRLAQTRRNRSSLSQFISAHRDHPFETLVDLSEQALKKWKSEILCYSPAAQEVLGCNAVLSVISGVTSVRYLGSEILERSSVATLAEDSTKPASVAKALDETEEGAISVAPFCTDCPPVKLTPQAMKHVQEHIKRVDLDKIENAKTLTDADRQELVNHLLTLSRDGKETTVLPPDVAIETVFRSIRPENFTEGTAVSTNYRLFRGRVEVTGTPAKTYEIDLVVCGEPSCKNDLGTFQRGDVISLYPKCGPGVVVVPRTSTLNGFLEGRKSWGSLKLKISTCK